MGGGENSETYWVYGRNISPITISKSIQAQRPNDFCSASIVAKNFIEVLLEKNVFPWTNPIGRSILQVRSSVLGPTWKTMEWKPPSVSTVQI